MSEEMIVRHCSPTLAGIKTGSLFACEHESKDEVSTSVRELNHRLVKKGLRVLSVRVAENRSLVYVYRPNKLKEDFSRLPVKSILEEYGYTTDNSDGCVVRLIRRLRSGGSFPHEIGLFLGYPADDVKGFIDNKGSHSKCTGYWKVYGDKKTAETLFAKYRKCTDIYCTLWKKGRSLERLTVSQ